MHLLRGVIMVVVIMLKHRHPYLVSATATGGAHLCHLHTQYRKLATCCYLYIGAAALAQQHKIVSVDIPAAASTVQPAWRLVDQELGAFERSAVSRQLE